MIAFSADRRKMKSLRRLKANVINGLRRAASRITLPESSLDEHVIRPNIS